MLFCHFTLTVLSALPVKIRKLLPGSDFDGNEEIAVIFFECPECHVLRGRYICVMKCDMVRCVVTRTQLCCLYFTGLTLYAEVKRGKGRASCQMQLNRNI